MPVKSKIPSIRKKYSKKETALSIIESATSAVRQILAMEDVIEKHKREMLSDMIWKISEANGRWNTRYFSEGVLNDDDTKLQHEHVVTRKQIIDQLLENPEKYKTILKKVAACVVTTDEHQRLNNSESGWERYKQSGIRVWDRLEEKWLW